MLVRHGATSHTADKRFSGGLASSNPGLTDEGRAQVREVADWLAPLGSGVDAVVTSPVRRTRESAEILAERLGLDLVEEPGFAEMEFGALGRPDLRRGRASGTRTRSSAGWARSTWPRAEASRSARCEERVLAGLERVLEAYAGKTVLVVSHVTPIKTLVAHAVDAPLASLFRMELSTASVSVVSFFGPSDAAPPTGAARCASTTRRRPGPGRCSTLSIGDPRGGTCSQPMGTASMMV